MAARRRRYGVATNLTDGASQFPPGTRGKKTERERKVSRYYKTFYFSILL